MPVEFEWRVDQDDSDEPFARIEPRRLPPWVWATVRWSLLSALILAALTYGVLRVRYEIVRASASRSIQQLLDTEAAAYAARDLGRYLALQDPTAQRWYSLQAQRFAPDCVPGAPACTERALGARCPQAGFSWGAPEPALSQQCAPVQPVTVERVELWDSFACASVETGSGLLRAECYRRTADGWLHTAPQRSFWGQRHDLLEGDLRLIYYERDEPYIGPLLDEVRAAHRPLAAALRFWSLPGRLEIEFSAAATALSGPVVDWSWADENTRLLLPSPWLLGIPQTGQWTASQYETVAYWTVYAALTARLQRDRGRLDATLLQRALLSEYSAWQLRGDLSSAPLLSRIVDRHGESELPRVFLSARGSRLVSLFLARWIGVHPSTEALFETMLNLEQEAIAHGQRETFLALQDPDWLPMQEQYYDRARPIGDGSIPLVRVHGLEVSGNRARVHLIEPPAPLAGYPQTTSDGVAEFRLVDWDWRHTRPTGDETGTSGVSADPTPEPD